MSDNIKTTLTFTGINTTFNHFDGRSYLVSTVQTPLGLNQFVTTAKVANSALPSIFSISANNTKDATINHIAVSRMAISTKMPEWSEDIAIDFVPITLVELMDSEVLLLDEISLRSDYCESILRMSGLNYYGGTIESELKDNPNNTYKYFLGLILFAVAGYHFINHRSLKEFLLSLFVLLVAIITMRLIFGSKFEFPSPIKSIKGKELLWKIFYLFEVLGGFLFLAILNCFSDPNLTVMIVWSTFLITYKIFTAFSLWKCAFNSNYKAWGYLARAFVLIEAVALLGFFSAIFIPMLHK